MTLEFSRVTLPPLWTVDQAKIHLHITGTAYDADIQQKLDAAQEAILSYLAVAADPTWTAATVPKSRRALHPAPHRLLLPGTRRRRPRRTPGR